MKTIIYNDDNLNTKDINKKVRRAKLVVVNSKDEILLACSRKNYYLIGGHVEDSETDSECLKREILEEAGVLLDIDFGDAYFSVEYLCKDYPNIGDNTNYIANYYAIENDLVPELSKVSLTEDEKEGDFTLSYIHKDKVVDILKKSLKNCTKEKVVKDTIDALEEYLRQVK